ncbi:MAG: PAS domain-containing sensor histidine kinase [Bacteroidales bacterium]|nr:PAS domain-containing sensor histidine kinase [Bacteroidales bacterium]
MKKKNDHATNATSLRQKAEERLNKLQSKTGSVPSEADMIKLIHELEVHQIELEMQNEELVIAKEKAEMAEEKYTELYDFAPSGYLSLSKEGKITELNFAAAKMLGKERLRLQNSLLSFFISAETKPAYNRFLEKVFSSKTKETCEVTLMVSGHPPMHVILSGICHENGQHCKLTATDITDRKQAEKTLRESEVELKELNAQKDKFFSIIGHDLKSPFNSILGFSGLLEEQIGEKNYDDVDKYAKTIRRSSQRAMDLLENLLEWSRAQTGKIEFSPESFKIINLTDNTFNQLKDAADQKSITLRNDLPTNLPVFADKNMVSTVMRNLISNAIKFTREGGEIKISAEKSAKEIFVSVSDNGIGIAPGRIEKLFRIDENDSTPGTNNEKGTGLGLILCKEFVEKHDGRIWVESVENKGSVFTFTLPRKAALDKKVKWADADDADAGNADQNG